MKLDELARSAVSDLLDASAVQAAPGLADLERRRRRSAFVRGASVVAVLVMIAGGLALVNASRGGPVQPAGAGPSVANGALLGFPADQSAPARVLAGSLPAGSVLQRLLPSLRKFWNVAFSPDGTELRYVTESSRRLVTVDLASGRRRTVWHCAGDDTTCSGWAVLSPDGHRVAHLRGYGDPRLEVTDLSTGKVLVYRPTEWAGPPAWSPDSTMLALATATGVTIVEPGLTSRLLVPVEIPQGFMDLAWSPDGTRVAYAEPRALDKPSGWTSFRLVVADVATGHTHAIRDLGRCVCLGLFPPQVAWSPDGQLIATTTITGRGLAVSGDVLLMRPDGSEVHRVGLNENFAWLAWQPVPAKD